VAENLDGVVVTGQVADLHCFAHVPAQLGAVVCPPLQADAPLRYGSFDPGQEEVAEAVGGDDFERRGISTPPFEG
jgi:hypothetical protein